MARVSAFDDGELSRSDMALVRQALRQDWPIPPAVKQRLLQRLVDYCDRETPEGAVATDRTVLLAARCIAAYCALTLKQQALDLAREKLEGRKSETDLADLVAEAEQRAEARERERAADGAAEPLP
jgi:hypothetical protein